MPKAYINYIFLDKQFKYAGAGNFSRVGISGTVKDHWYTDAVQLQNISVPKNGYIFVYVSNESNLDVFFDNLQVIHKPGPILEETHYYPFGLTMAGISSRAATGALINKKKYNGIEFDNDLDIDTYEAELRNLDPQTGRWWQVDPETENMEMWSPYTSNYDNPILYKDPRGNEGEACCDELSDALEDAGNKIMISLSGTVTGALNTVSFGIISSDPFNLRPHLNSEEKMYFDNARDIGKVAPLFTPGTKSAEVALELEPVPVGVPKTMVKTEPASLNPPISNTKQSISNSTTGTSSVYQKPPAHSSAMKSIVKNASKPGVALSDAKVTQLKKVVNQSGGTVRTEVGQTGSVKGVKHSHVEGYGTKIAKRHIIHKNQN